MHVAAWHRRTQNQSSPNLGQKCLFARPLTVQNFAAIRQQVSEISTTKIPQKFFMGYCSPKTLINPNFVAIGLN